MIPRSFDHEKPAVYRRSIDFAVWSMDVLERLPKSLAVQQQSARTSTPVPLNIAEGTGKTPTSDRCGCKCMSRFKVQYVSKTGKRPHA